MSQGKVPAATIKIFMFIVVLCDGKGGFIRPFLFTCS